MFLPQVKDNSKEYFTKCQEQIDNDSAIINQKNKKQTVKGRIDGLF
jgi:hypothetical protein